MNRLPHGWTATKLREVVSLKTGPFGSSLHKSDYVESGVPIINPMHIANGKIVPSTKHQVSEHTAERLRDFRLRQGEIVMGRRGEMGRCAIVGHKEAGWLCGTGSLIVRGASGIQPQYLQLYLSSNVVVKYLMQASVGSTMLNLNQDVLLDVDISIPPIAEQKRIVEKVEELTSDLDAGVAELQAAQNKLTQYRQSLLKAAVEGALTADWRAERAKRGEPIETGAQLLKRILRERRTLWESKQLVKFAEQGKSPSKDWKERYPEPAQPDATSLPALSESWIWASVDQCSLNEYSITDGPFGSNLKSSHYQEHGPRVIRLQNIGDGVFLDAKAHISESHFAELAKHAVQEGDVVIAMLGEVLPRACIIPNEVAPAIVKADCARVRLNTNVMRPAVLMAQLNSKPIRDVVGRFVKGIGRPRVNLGHIRAIPVALCPTDEQLQLESVLLDAYDLIDQQNEAIERSLKQAIAQRKNILKAAFSGQLVSQDPNDEPANVLLERIRADRAARAAAPKSTVRKARANA